MFCYIIYNESAILPMQRFGEERPSKSPLRHKIQFAPVIERVLITPSMSSQMKNSSEGDVAPRSQSSQLALQKSFEMINKYISHEIGSYIMGDQSVSIVQENNSSLEEIASMAKAYESEDTMKRRIYKRKSKLVVPKTPKSPKQTQRYNEQDDPNTSLMINPDCYVQIIMDYIYCQLRIDKASGVLLDLCDEHGNMLRLFDYNKCDSGMNIFKDRKTYYVVEYTLNDDGSFKSLDPKFGRGNMEESEIYGKIVQVVNKYKLSESVITKGKNVKLSNSRLSARKSSISNDL